MIKLFLFSANSKAIFFLENKMYMIGGWLGSGTYAAVDVYVLNLGTLALLQINLNPSVQRWNVD